MILAASLLLTVTPAHAALAAPTPDAAVYDWTPATSVSLRYFVTDWLQPYIDYGEDAPAQFSPDRNHFFFVSFRADTEKDETVYELWIYSTKEVENALRLSSKQHLAPQRKILMRSSARSEHGSAAIFLPEWHDNASITFVGTRGSNTRQVFRYELPKNQLRELTHPHDRLCEPTGYAVRGETVMFDTCVQEPLARKTYPFQVLSPERLYELSGRDGPGDISATHWRIHASTHGFPGKQIAMSEQNYNRGTYHSEPQISPNENWAVIVYRPEDWTRTEGYAFKPGYWYCLFNLRTGERRPLFKTPQGAGLILSVPIKQMKIRKYDHSLALWSFDSRHLLIFNTALPINQPSSSSLRETSYVVDYDILANTWSIVDTFGGKEVSLATPTVIEDGRTIRMVFGSDGGITRDRTYSYKSGMWQAGETPQRLKRTIADPLTISVRQGPNYPPRIVAVKNGKELNLTGPDPALATVRRAEVRQINWRDSGGQDVQGQLLLPVTATPSATQPITLPVIVQFVNVSLDAFSPDGRRGTADAAQSLAAQGYAVLRVVAAGGYGTDREADPELMLSPEEFPAQVRRIDESINALGKMGILPDGPIGLIGFSRSGAYTYYIATHPGKTKVGAAVAFDSITAGFGEYLELAGTRGADEARAFDKQYGNGSNYWHNKAGWQDASDFNLDRLQTPMLFHRTGNPVIYGVTETMGALLLAHRPFEYHYQTGSSHMMQSPRQQLNAMQTTVDWMNFWLRNKEISSSDDPDRLERWRKIRLDWEQTKQREIFSSTNTEAQERVSHK